MFSNGLQKQEPWAKQLLDANDLFPASGTLNGVLAYPGFKEECFEVGNDETDPVKGKYWMMTSINSSVPSLWGLGFVRLGRCFPSGCNEEDVRATMDYALYNLTKVHYTSVVLNSHSLDESIEMTAGDITMIVFISLVSIVVLFSTIIDILITVFELEYIKTGYLHIIQGFSVYNNTIKLFNTDSNPNDPNNLSCLNGLRAISISWVVVGHTLLEMSPLGSVTSNGILLKNLGSFAKDGGPVDQLAITPFWNGMSSVDTFFMMGATLLVFHTFREMEKLRGKPMIKWIVFWATFYLHRYIRLTSIYAIVIALHATLLKYLADGPMSYLITKQVDKCASGWYYNVLYINNFAYEIEDDSADKLCMGWTWYMANDMQFFVITPFLLGALYFSTIGGLLVCGGFLIAATATPFILTWNDETQFYHGETYGFYQKPWNRFQPYIIGIMFGFLLHKIRHIKVLKISSMLNMFIWLIAAVVAMASVYGPADSNLVKDFTIQLPINPYYPSQLDRSFFNGFSKIAWCLPLGWVILSCVKGRGGVVNSFLSWGLWMPIAKMSYCIYLVQYTVIFYFNSQMQNSVVYTTLLYIYTALGNFAFCCFVSFVLVLLFEAPTFHLEKLLFGLLGIGRMPTVRKEKKTS